MHGIMNTKAGTTQGFTLVEMLLVVSLIAMLIALLLPSLKMANRMAERTVCMSNLNVNGTGLVDHAITNGGKLPPKAPETGTQAHLIYSQSHNFDMRVEMEPYLGGFGSWSCPSVNAVPIDDPDNTRAYSYSPYRYYAGRDYPDFGLVQHVPRRLNSAVTPGSTTLMQDVMAQLTAVRPWIPTPGGGQPGDVIFNHGSGSLYTFAANNPSWKFQHSVDYNANDGGNLLMYDQSVQWIDSAELDLVGEWNSGGLGTDLGFLP